MGLKQDNLDLQLRAQRLISLLKAMNPQATGAIQYTSDRL